jgi:hypothetical protein
VLLALVVALIRRRVPRLRRIVDAEQAALTTEAVTSGTNAALVGGAHDRHRADDCSGHNHIDQVRNSGT